MLKVSVFVIGLFVRASLSASIDCKTDQCAKPAKLYEELGCKAVYGPKSCCAKRFDCPDFQKLDDNKCTYEGKEYNIGEILPRSLTNNKCVETCFCTRQGNEPAKFTCETSNCGVASLPAPGCINIYGDLNECCSTSIVCDDTEKESLASCFVESKEYREGEKFISKSNPCHECLCHNEFDNSTITDNPHCRKLNCEIDLRYKSFVQRGCLPVFHSDQCCPVDWECPKQSKKVIKREASDAEDEGHTEKQDKVDIVTPSKNLQEYLDIVNLANARETSSESTSHETTEETVEAIIREIQLDKSLVPVPSVDPFLTPLPSPISLTEEDKVPLLKLDGLTTLPTSPETDVTTLRVETTESESSAEATESSPEKIEPTTELSLTTAQSLLSSSTEASSSTSSESSESTETSNSSESGEKNERKPKAKSGEEESSEEDTSAKAPESSTELFSTEPSVTLQDESKATTEKSTSFSKTTTATSLELENSPATETATTTITPSEQLKILEEPEEITTPIESPTTNSPNDDSTVTSAESKSISINTTISTEETTKPTASSTAPSISEEIKKTIDSLPKPTEFEKLLTTLREFLDKFSTEKPGSPVTVVSTSIVTPETSTSHHEAESSTKAHNKNESSSDHAPEDSSPPSAPSTNLTDSAVVSQFEKQVEFVNFTVSAQKQDEEVEVSQSSPSQKSLHELEGEVDSKVIIKRSPPVEESTKQSFNKFSKDKGCIFNGNFYKLGEVIKTNNDCIKCACEFAPIGFCVLKDKCNL